MDQSPDPKTPPVSLLPTELLYEVFCYLPCHIADLLRARQKPETPTWLAVTQVCRYWRRVAYTCRELWAHIPLENKYWTKLALELSKDVPIVVEADEFKWMDRKAILTALKSAGRARTIKWTIAHDEPATAPKLPRLKSEPAQLLESFQLYFPQGDEDEDIYIFLPHDLLLGPFPRLREVKIRRATMLESSPFLSASSLVTLSLSETKVWRTYRRMVHTLRHLPNLQKLTMSDSIPRDVVTVEPIVLPQLLELDITDSLNSVKDLLEMIITPRCRRLELNCRIWRSETTYETVSANITAITTSRFSQAIIAGDSYQAVSFSYPPDDFQREGVAFIAEQPLLPNSLLPEHLCITLLTIDIEDDLELQEMIVAHTCSTLPLLHVKTLEVSSSVLERSCACILGLPYADVTQITVHGTTAGAFFLALDETQTGGVAGPHLPSLKTIVIERGDFISTHRENGTPFMCYVMDVMAARNEDPQYPPCKLVLRRCLVSAEMVAIMRKSGEIDWDGVFETELYLPLFTRGFFSREQSTDSRGW
ncbi:hypothetical protein BV25DRAFT_724670 [Artomyces pyxidatus]|uniref:Uncharacterized protein n=1 Tax=Artomyces pyxidatus TaxID=48021 RepID=A0ACB8SZD1_9AGAM|nr:hypothetical protein BV25DRAFT_724670 [Artomyces pyxidatus]